MTPTSVLRLVARAAGPLLAVFAIGALASACRQDEGPEVPPNQYGQPGYGPGGYGPPAGGNNPQGNPLGLPCATDGNICGAHRCNLAAQRCAFPCGGPQDCMPGFGCAAGICALGVPR